MKKQDSECWLKKSLTPLDQFHIKPHHIFKIRSADPLIGTVWAFEVFVVHAHGHEAVNIGRNLTKKTRIGCAKHQIRGYQHIWKTTLDRAMNEPKT